MVIPDVYIILIISLIALLICIINEFLRLKKEVGIVKLLGYSKKISSTITIVNSYLKLFVFLLP